MAKKKKVEELVQMPWLQGAKMDRLQEFYNQWYACRRCFLGELRSNEGRGEEIVFGDGNPDAAVLILGEAPGQEEERDLLPFIGASGQLLNQILALVSDSPDIQQLSAWYDKASRSKDNIKKFHDAVYEWRKKNFFITNVVACRPPDNRTPTGIEVKACYERVRALIYIVDPKLIITVGKTALECLLGKTAEITMKRGYVHEIEIDGRVGKVKYPVMPTLHPSYLLRKADWKVKGGDYQKTVGDFLKAMRMIDELALRDFNIPVPYRVEASQ